MAPLCSCLLIHGSEHPYFSTGNFKCQENLQQIQPAMVHQVLINEKLNSGKGDLPVHKTIKGILAVWKIWVRYSLPVASAGSLRVDTVE